MELYDYQIDAVNRLKNGSILCGNVGSGKSRVALMYYFTKIADGRVPINGEGKYECPSREVNLYIITPAKKRDDKEWESELAPFLMSPETDGIVIDSWNNIQKYKDVYGAFFIFDEQHVTGHGKWSKSFIKICRRNKWILLSATPGDKWEDYISIFIANGFCQNKTEFEAKYCVFSPFVSYKKIQSYLRERELEKMRDSILVIMKDVRVTERHQIHKICEYDRDLYRTVWRDRWNPYDNEPIQEISKAMYLIRRVVNSDQSRFKMLEEVFSEFDRVIIFYNFDYELEAIKEFFKDKIYIAEWNGHKHEKIPSKDSWIYLVQYAAGAEGWNCTETDTIIFYSQTYSYKTLVQAKGRIDRLNSPYKDLYYFHLKTRSSIDISISRALSSKKQFNEKKVFSSLLAKKTRYM